MVINVRTISTANAPMATQSFFITESWCTGEDSNLRSPLGAADLQSAAINHSATCARPAEQNCLAGNRQICYQISKNHPSLQQILRQHSATGARCYLRAKSLLRKLLLGSVLLESSASCLACFSCYASRRAQGLKSGAGEGI